MLHPELPSLTSPYYDFAPVDVSRYQSTQSPFNSEAPCLSSRLTRDSLRDKSQSESEKGCEVADDTASQPLDVPICAADVDRSVLLYEDASNQADSNKP